MTDYDDLPFKIERWTKGYGEPEETIAMCADLLSAKAAFEAAVKRRPIEYTAQAEGAGDSEVVGRGLTLDNVQSRRGQWPAGQEIPEIENDGLRLTGCLTCNLWAPVNGDRWVRLSEEDLRARKYVLAEE